MHNANKTVNDIKRRQNYNVIEKKMNYDIKERE